jgi:DNA-binding MarR family transcriptional regulator
MSAPELPPQAAFTSCVCLNLNRAARGTTRRYDAAFKDIGITSGQFSLLATLAPSSPIALGRLAEALGVDRTTLNRNIKPLEESGLVRTVADPDDARVRALELTKAGQKKLSVAVPVWRRVQNEAEARIGGETWTDLRLRLATLS